MTTGTEWLNEAATGVASIIRADLTVLTSMPEKDLRHALWHYGDHTNGQQPGSHAESLMLTIGKADMFNLERHRTGFPYLVRAMEIAGRVKGGTDLIRAELDRRDGGQDV